MKNTKVSYRMQNFKFWIWFKDYWWAVMVRGYLELRRNCYASYLEQILFWNYLQSIIHFCRKHIDIEYFNCIVTSDWLTIENHKGRDTSWQTFNKISQKSQMAINRPHIAIIGTITLYVAIGISHITVVHRSSLFGCTY